MKRAKRLVRWIKRQRVRARELSGDTEQLETYHLQQSMMNAMLCCKI